MKLAKILLLTGLLATAVASQANGPQFKIIGGNDAELGEWPWASAIIATDGNPFDAQFCGATLVHHNWAVTAAHCVYDNSGEVLSAGDIQVLVGAHTLSLESLEPDSVRTNVTRIIVHPEYNHGVSFRADIALLELSSRTLNKVARLPNSSTAANVNAGDLATAAGWGTTSTTNQNRPDVLQEVDLPIYDQADCNTAYGGAIDETMVCAGFPAGGKDSCQGDSGGPLLIELDGQWTLIGVTSFGDGCAQAGKPGVYANVMHFHDWIYQHIDSLSFDQGHFYYLEGVDNTAQLSRTLLNHTRSNVTVTEVAFETGGNNDSSVFSITQNSCLLQTLSPGQGCEVTIDYIGANQADLYASNITASYTADAGVNTVDAGIVAVFTLDAAAGLETILEAPDLSFYSGGNGNWAEDTSVSNNSPSSAKSATIDHSEISAILTYVEGPADINFDLKVSSEANYDGAVLFVNNAAQAIVSGEQNWTTVNFTVPAGTHKLWAYYSKDVNTVAGTDAAYIDNFSTAPASDGDGDGDGDNNGDNSGSNGSSGGSGSGGGGGGGNGALLLVLGLLCLIIRRRLPNAYR